MIALSCRQEICRAGPHPGQGENVARAAIGADVVAMHQLGRLDQAMGPRHPDAIREGEFGPWVIEPGHVAPETRRPTAIEGRVPCRPTGLVDQNDAHVCRLGLGSDAPLPLQGLAARSGWRRHRRRRDPWRGRLVADRKLRHVRHVVGCWRVAARRVATKTERDNKTDRPHRGLSTPDQREAPCPA